MKSEKAGEFDYKIARNYISSKSFPSGEFWGIPADYRFRTAARERDSFIHNPGRQRVA